MPSTGRGPTSLLGLLSPPGSARARGEQLKTPALIRTHPGVSRCVNSSKAVPCYAQAFGAVCFYVIADCPHAQTVVLKLRHGWSTAVFQTVVNRTATSWWPLARDGADAHGVGVVVMKTRTARTKMPDEPAILSELFCLMVNHWDISAGSVN